MCFRFQRYHISNSGKQHISSKVNTSYRFLDYNSGHRSSNIRRGKKVFTNTSKINLYMTVIRTHGSGFYVGLASWAWFSNERYKTVTKRCLYSPARI